MKFAGKRCLGGMIAILFVFLLIGFPISSDAEEIGSSVYISEFMANNSETLLDGDGDASDWIEFHNPTDTAVSLNDWYLSDNASQWTKWQFPSASEIDLTLQPGGYLVVFASGKEASDSGSPYIDSKSYVHTNFKLGVEGESVILVQSDGKTIISSYLDYPSQKQDVSYGISSTQAVGYFLTPTPASANQTSVLGFIEDTKFSVDRGFYEESFELEITTASEGAAIRYTLDGSEPSMSNGLDYSGPITIEQTTTLRAAAFRDGYQPSNVDTQTYLFIADVIHQSPNGEKPSEDWPNPGSGSSSGGPGGRPGNPGNPGGSSSSQVYDYGMDPDVIEDPRYADVIDDALLSIASISIVTDLDNLFGTQNGIYANAQQDGKAWERPASVELLNPDGSKGFQVNAGLRIRGGVSRQSSNPKHSFRLFFRSEYGDAKLKYPLFEDEGVDEYDKLDLRTGQNFSWHATQGGSVTYSTWLYDVFTRDAHRAMGQPYTRSRYYHLYINGQYWGLYQSEERPEANYAASYFGDDDDDYDAVKSGDNNGAMEATDGTLDALYELWTEINAGMTDNDAYFRIQGLSADGLSIDLDYPKLLDVDNLIDYMLLVFYGGNRDMPIGGPGSDSMPRNLFAFYNRENPDGFKFVAHDSEHTLGVHLSQGVNFNRVNVTLTNSLGQKKNCNPWWMHTKLIKDNAEYQLRFADRVQKHFFHEGVLTADKTTEMFLARKNEIDMAVIGESARWGDYTRSSNPCTKDDEWLPIVNRIVNNYLQASPSSRTEVVYNQIKAKGWLPTIDAPTFSQHGGIVEPGYSVTVEASSGTIYYTLHGEDPRLPGGAIHPTAIAYAGESIPIVQRTRIMARAYEGEVWSAVSDATFGVQNEVKNYLRITEIQYNPAEFSDEEKAHGFESKEDFEYIELLNTSDDLTLDLSNVQFTEGILFDFSQGTIKTLEPGALVLVVSHSEAFENRYGGDLPVTGVFDGHLSNSGEMIQLLDSNGEVIHAFAYDDQLPWPEEADGKGSSLEVIDVQGDYGDPTNWRASEGEQGTPGEWMEDSDPSRTDAWILY